VGRHRKTTRTSSYAAAPLPPPRGEEGRRQSAQDAGETSKEPRTARARGKSSSPARGSEMLAPGLYLVATPIGNASDIGLRALDVLSHCDAIVAEDTRVTSRLLAIHGIRRPLATYNDHNAPQVRPKLIRQLVEGARLALVSDAGTPLVSDPGHKLVREARAAGAAVIPVPGASAALAALVASGLPSDRFLFAGFLPPRAGERRTVLAELAMVPATLIFFESPQRLSESLADMAEILGGREAVVARELTKLHEEFRAGPLDGLADAYSGAPPKGEITLVVAPPVPGAPAGREKMHALLAEALAFMPVNAASRLVAEALGLKRRAVYAAALALKGGRP
jgi:16S rRNA (cytidine1402-2'-O)-methyltransferase